MTQQEIMALLEGVRDGTISVTEAEQALKQAPFTDLGFAKVDHHRALRQGTGEVLYGASKTPEQILSICENLLAAGGKNILVTRMSAAAAAELADKLPLFYDPVSRLGLVNGHKKLTADGTILVATAGTSDMPVAEEAAQTAEALGNRVTRLYDVGVSGLHRLLSHLDEVMRADVIIAIAGMEGALASVISGLADCPVIAVPTSVGYGASFEGLAALLSMLNACASGVSVVNIDNGFGAGYLASMINHRGSK
ncbi:MAG: nickel pincer cofactor biosynthesis protein LarB [Ruthenibacterium sp.]